MELTSASAATAARRELVVIQVTLTFQNKVMAKKATPKKKVAKVEEVQPEVRGQRTKSHTAEANGLKSK